MQLSSDSQREVDVFRRAVELVGVRLCHAIEHNTNDGERWGESGRTGNRTKRRPSGTRLVSPYSKESLCGEIQTLHHERLGARNRNMVILHIGELYPYSYPMLETVSQGMMMIICGS